METVTREQLEAALADLASGGTADAIAERLRSEGIKGWPNLEAWCPVSVWLSRRTGARVCMGMRRAWALAAGYEASVTAPVAAQDFRGAFDGGRFNELCGDPSSLLTAVA